MKKIIFTGGSGKFGKVFKKINSKKNIYYPSSNIFDVTNLKTYLLLKLKSLKIKEAGLKKNSKKNS